VDVNIQDQTTKSALHHSGQNGHEIIVTRILQVPNVDVNIQDKDGCTPLHYSAKMGHEAVVIKLLEAPHVDVNMKSQFGKTALHYSAGMGHEAVVIKLLGAPNVDVNIQNEDGCTPLHSSAERGHEAVVIKLLEAPHVDVNFKSRFGKTALHYSAQTGLEAAVIKILEAPNVDVNMIDHDGCTPLHYSAQGGREAVVIKLLEDPKVNVNIQDKDGCTPLHYSAQRGREAVVIKLLEAPNVNVNVVTRQHENALHLAVLEDNVSMVKILATNQQLRVTQENLDGETPFQIAFEMKKPNSKSIERLLSEHPSVKNYVDVLYRDRQVYVDAANAILVGAALIATLTFACWLQPPLGYSTFYGETYTNVYPAPPTSNPSYVDMEHHKVLEVFWVFNSLAFYFSIATLLWGAQTVLPMRSIFIKRAVVKVQRNLLVTAFLLNVSVPFVLIAFALAGYVVLPPIKKFSANIISTSALGGFVCVVALIHLMKNICTEGFVMIRKGRAK
jgi:ankyrin repeat protein